MRYISAFRKKRTSVLSSFDFLLQLWNNYHFLFFRSLIFRGLKLKAFFFFIKIKKGLKSFEKFDPAFIFFLTMLQITPSLFLKHFKRGGNSFEVPFFLSYWKRISYACRWVLKLLKQKDGFFTINNIIDNLISSLDGKGLALRKKFEIYDIAEKNSHLLKNKVFNK